MNLSFTKMHGTGNDFVLIDARAHTEGAEVFGPDGDAAGLARKLCHRRFGIGADQVLVLRDSGIADFAMAIYNADGGEVEMCGNGIRCLAKYVWDRGISTKEVLEVETPGGIIRPAREGNLVRVDMGEPVLEGPDIPVNLEGRVVDHPIQVQNEPYSITCVSMGNPHAVIFLEDVDGFPVGRVGPLIESLPLFPNRTNVEFVQVVSPEKLRMRVWERGSGETMACGTGACAAAVAANLKGVAERNVLIHLKGGDLGVEWNGQNNRVMMSGPAVEVFRGSVEV